LAAPYFIPLLVMLTSLFFAQYTRNVCPTLTSVILLCLIAAIIGVHGFTVLRFSYLRYLYFLLAKASDREIKVHKVLASVSFGIFGSIMAAVLNCLFWIAISVPYIYTHAYSMEANNVINIMYVIQVLVSAAIGMLFSVMDLVVNWKRIKEKGFLHMLTFEDPLHIRLDLLSIAGIFITLVVIIVLNAVNPVYGDVAVGFVKLLTFFFVYQLAGCTVIVLEWIRWIRVKMRLVVKTKDQLEVQLERKSSNLEEIMRDETFFELFKSYCEKEFSLENAKLYEALIELENKSMNNNGMISKEDFKQLYQTFFQSYSKYEVNVPSKVKKDLEHFLTQDVTPFHHLKESIHIDLFLNLKDTYDRLKDTDEYQRWSLSREIQLKQSVV